MQIRFKSDSLASLICTRVSCSHGSPEVLAPYHVSTLLAAAVFARALVSAGGFSAAVAVGVGAGVWCVVSRSGVLGTVADTDAYTFPCACSLVPSACGFQHQWFMCEHG